jgi:hypothetical protein
MASRRFIMKSKTNIEHLILLVVIALIISALTKLVVLGPLGLAILAGFAIAAYAIL